MPTPNNIKIFNKLKKDQQRLTKFITPITDNDEKLFKSYLTSPITQPFDEFRLNFEDSFEYIRMYFKSGNYQGFKFYDDESLIIFALEKKKKTHFKLFKPLGPQVTQKISEIIAALSSCTKYPIQAVCLDNKSLKVLKNDRRVEVKNIKEFRYYIYDLDILDGLRGNQWKTVRQKITSFKKNNPELKAERLSTENMDEVVHFIGGWRRELLSKRRLSYANLEKNKFAVRYYADTNDFKNIWSTVYRLQNRIVAFQLLYRLGVDSAAHTIGLADTAIKGLSEATQIDTWEQLHDNGIRFINDGPSWRPGLEIYKRKFNPITAQQVFECKLQSRIP